MQSVDAIKFFPDSASSISPYVDAHFAFLCGVTIFFSTLVGFLVIYFGIKYRADAHPVATQIHGSIPLEIAWTVIPLGIVVFIFAWGAALYLRIFRPPANAMDVYVIGKQWMWKAEHPSGQREINNLHVPIDRPVRLTITSQDVMHSYSLPDMRIKREATPGRYNTVWFEATKVGSYHIFCTQYCGTKHSAMIGTVTAMEPGEYEKWLAGGADEGSLAAGGEKLFQSMGCNTCHRGDSQQRGPNLAGLYNNTVYLQDGKKIVADEAYLRESILQPTAKIVQGFQPIMPTFQGQLSEENVIQLIEYIKALQDPEHQMQTIHNQQQNPPILQGGNAATKLPGTK
jgi:cytochrome c oxidase subunit II